MPQLHETGKPTTTKVGPTKSGVAEVVIPHFLTDVVLSLKATAKPDGVRESLRRARSSEGRGWGCGRGADALGRTGLAPR